MWAPSTSASVITMILWYRASSRSKSSSTPVPIAVIIAEIISLASTLSIRFFSTLMIFPNSGSTAWVERSRACFAEPPAESPSTMNSSVSVGSRTVQSASLPGRVEFSSADLRRVRSRALRAAGAARGGVDRLQDDPPRVGRVLLEELAELAVDDRLDEALDRRVAELASSSGPRTAGPGASPRSPRSGPRGRRRRSGSGPSP